ncbi:hypothetical protein GGI25_005542 [Coemansia spiralis]|uniref:Uncharacterized protein n=1 Tax=Coemansia spiralis TaxID=417178 RepID=A0A9W8KWC9_9FUNG|nr:hypothetical protein GGI25_005542 [Coemansia spiralis]
MYYTQMEHNTQGSSAAVMSSWPRRHIPRSTDDATAPATASTLARSRSRSRSNSPALGSSPSRMGGNLGLNIFQGKRPVMTMLAEPTLHQLQSPTAPSDDAFYAASNSNSNSTRRQSTSAPSECAVGSSSGATQGNYTLDPEFIRHWEKSAMPPLPPVPQAATANPSSSSSFPSRLSVPDTRIRFPRPEDEPPQRASSTSDNDDDANDSGTDSPAPGQQPPPPPQQQNGVVRRRKISALDGQDSAFSRPSRSTTAARSPVTAYAKRNFSLPAALAPPVPKLELENYEFTSLERLERRWADVKTESTRILSSAIYKYYFNHGEWHEFEQVFPGKVLAVWEDFQSKLSVSELAFVNTILVSQNPFSRAEGDSEKNIPVLARTLPLTQVVRSTILSEDMRSRESHSVMHGGASEIDPEFADWLISRFNALKAGITSPSQPTFVAGQKASAAVSAADTTLEQEKKSKVEQQQQQQQLNHKPSQTDNMVQPKQQLSTKPSRSQLQRPELPQKSQQQQQQQQQSVTQPEKCQQTHLSLGLNTPPLTAESSSSTRSSTNSSTSSSAAPATTTVPAAAVATSASASRPKTPSLADVARSLLGSSGLRRKKTLENIKPESAPQTAPQTAPIRRTTVTVPGALQPSVYDTVNRSVDLNLPPSPPKKSAQSPAAPSVSRSETVKSRRHTHNFFSSSGTATLAVEPRRSTESVRSHRITREIQMKDLPPLPQNAAELAQGPRGAEKAALMHRPSIGKKPGIIAHFSSHAELTQRTPIAVDKPRSSSMTVDTLDKLRGRPSTSASIMEPRSSKSSSQSRDSGSAELRFAIVYDWRPAPEDGDTSWGFRISPLAMGKSVTRKKSSAGMVVHSHTPTMNRRRLPNPQKGDAPAKKDARLARPKAPMPEKQKTDEQAAKDSGKAASHEQQQQQAAQRPQTPSPQPQKTSVDVPPELPKAKMPQGELGLGISGDSKSAGVAVGAAGVRGVLYELAYLSTQSRNVWSKSEHVFTNMQKVGLEVNRIAEQDFYDFCVDELLKASNDAYQDLQSLGSKKMAKGLYESFNAKLTVLLSGSNM